MLWQVFLTTKKEAEQILKNIRLDPFFKQLKKRRYTLGPFFKQPKKRQNKFQKIHLDRPVLCINNFSSVILLKQQAVAFYYPTLVKLN